MVEQGKEESIGPSAQKVAREIPGRKPATPGSYGLAPSGFRLPAGTRLGPVRLQVAELARSLDFYEGVVGLQLLSREKSWARLGIEAKLLVELRERKGALPVPHRGRTGLFHFALLLPHRDSLGRFARHLAQNEVPAGAADHSVSEALYLQDPDNLGIEVYADRPRAVWQRIGRELTMTTDPLDMTGLLEAGGGEPWKGVPKGTVIGHLHLRVGDLGRASKFFSETLGFDRTVRHYPGALFLGADGYHHHLGTNIWAGRDASPPTADEAQLMEWTIELPDATSVKAAAQSLERNRYGFQLAEGSGAESTVTTRDPWGTSVRLRSGQVRSKSLKEDRSRRGASPEQTI